MSCREGVVPPAVETPPCIYLASLRNDEADNQPSYQCLRHGTCTLKSNAAAIAACTDCKDYLKIDGDLSKFVDPLRVTDARKHPTTALHGLLAGAAVFLVGGGPSLKAVDTQQLNTRGIWSLGINNVAGNVPVNAFVCSDPPRKFHWGIFADPRIMKFLPVPKLGSGRDRGRMRQKLKDGTFEWLKVCAKDCPNVWGFERRSWIMPDATFFTDPAASWGSQDVGVRLTGQPKTACTMLLGLRILHYLGARTVFLLGCDFRMSPDSGYAFNQERTQAASDSNNTQFRIVNDWLVQLRPTFERFNFKVYNCYRESGLRAFDYVPFEKALEICRGLIPNEEFDLAGWYDKTG